MRTDLRRKTLELCVVRNDLKQMWMDYVKQKGVVQLDGACITIFNGASERMEKLEYNCGVVEIVDVFGNRYDFAEDAGLETLLELHDVVLTKKE